MKKIKYLMIALILSSFALGALIYPSAPEEVPSHWNTQGEVDDYTSKEWGLFLGPIVASLIFLMYLAIPRIDPLKRNLNKFRGYFDVLILMLIGFMIYLQVITIISIGNSGLGINVLISPAIGILFYYIGILLKKSKRTWFIGLRTPWTLSSDEVWRKTHDRGSVLFKLAGIIAFSGVLLPDYGIYLVVGPVLVFSIYLVIYSYWLYKEIEGL